MAPGDDLVKRDPSGPGPFPNGTEVSYSCPEGYEFYGDTTAVCEYGEWIVDVEPNCTGMFQSLHIIFFEF